MAAPKGTHFVISGNFLKSGAPAYRRSDGAWTGRLQEARAASATERDDMLAEAVREEDVVADAYAFAVRLEGSAIDPLTARESIRANGPTVGMFRPAAAKAFDPADGPPDEAA